jgi:hypothetical protein
MSEETGFEGWNEDAGDAIGGMVDGVTALLDGDPEAAVDGFLDGSGAAVNFLTGGLAGEAVEVFEDLTGFDVREGVEDATEYVGEALGGFAYDVVQGAGEVVDDVVDLAGDAVDAVGDAAGEAWDAVTSIFD